MRSPEPLPRRAARASSLAGVLAVAAGLFAALARPQISRWGTTHAEREACWPGDELVPRPGFVWTNAITIERPAAEVWPWIAQLGQGRGGLYSYAWLENALGCDIHNADRILAEHQQQLQVGDRVIRMARYAPYNPVALFAPGRALVLGDVGDTAADLAAGRPRSTWAFILDPVDRNTCRLLVRSRAGGPAVRVQGPFQFVMQRRTMVGIKQRAEGTPGSAADELEPVLWLVAAGVLAGGGIRGLVQREEWWRPFVVATTAGAVLPVLMFWQPPVALGAALDAALVRGLVRSAPVPMRRRR